MLQDCLMQCNRDYVMQMVIKINVSWTVHVHYMLVTYDMLLNCEWSLPHIIM